MKIDQIAYGESTLGNDTFLKDGAAYLNEKFKNMSEDQIKQWILNKGTTLTPAQTAGVMDDIMLDKVKGITSPRLILAIEECLETLAYHFQIPTGGYKEV
jgi:hypothetical protein